ncbi:Serine/arginine-rich splicing factor SR45a [Canna indica]|uniref:Serine/arginine-rich splicing factor SR45a n=1 Tax=Canna indica TaxID=4628 RepID=A0AAQ3KK66_9LILI|nr:Serine/arginine-rich splicing factor SR45a [Canna indica]
MYNSSCFCFFNLFLILFLADVVFKDKVCFSLLNGYLLKHLGSTYSHVTSFFLTTFVNFRYESYSRSVSRSPSYSRSVSRSLSRSRSRSRSRDSIDAENPGNNLYVTGLSSRVTEDELLKHFESEGKVTDVHLVLDPWTRESRGFGFVTMATIEEANRCIKFLDRSVLEGRVITVEKLLPLSFWEMFVPIVLASRQGDGEGGHQLLVDTLVPELVDGAVLLAIHHIIDIGTVLQVTPLRGISLILHTTDVELILHTIGGTGLGQDHTPGTQGPTLQIVLFHLIIAGDTLHAHRAFHLEYDTEGGEVILAVFHPGDFQGEVILAATHQGIEDRVVAILAATLQGSEDHGRAILVATLLQIEDYGAIAYSPKARRSRRSPSLSNSSRPIKRNSRESYAHSRSVSPGSSASR